MPTNTHPLVMRIRRARAAITLAEQDLIGARDHDTARAVRRLEHDLENRRAYLGELLATARLMPRP